MPDNNDIVFAADIDDRTIQFFERFDRNMNRLESAGVTGFENVEGAIRDVGPQIGIVAGLVTSLTTKLIDMGLKGLNAVKQFVQGSIQLTARVDVLGTVLNRVGTQAGYSAEEIAIAEEAVKSMGITTQASRQSLIQLAQANIDWSEAAKLARIAQNAAVVAGVNSSQAFERMVLAINKQEPMLLRSLGIVLRLDETYSAMADTLGKTTKELTEAERRQAFLNEIYRKSAPVMGTYEDAMGNAGKQAGSMARHVEELQLALGRAFQPAFSAQIQFMTENLKQMKAWFDENEEAVENFARQLGILATALFELVDRTLDFLAKAPGLIEKMGIGLARAVNSVTDAMDEDEFEKSAAGWQTAGKQLVSILVAIAATGASAIKQVISLAIEEISHLFNVAKNIAKFIGRSIKGDIEGANEALEDVESAADAYAAFRERASEDLDKVAENAKKAGEDAFESMTDFFWGTQKGAEDTEEALDGVTDAADGAGDAAAEAFNKVNEALEALSAELAEEDAERELKASRDRIERALRLSHKIQDIERQHKERISKIREDAIKEQQESEEERADEVAEFLESAAERRAKLEERRSDDMIKIEEDYQREILRIQSNFERDVREASGARDAKAIARLRRQRRDELKEAEKTRDERRKDADKDYDKRLKDLNEALAKEEKALEESHKEQIKAEKEAFEEQIKQANDARQKQFEDLNRSLERERQFRDLHRRWKEQDRQREFDKELREIGRQFASIEGLTEEGLADILEQWEDHFGDLTELMEAYSESLEEMAEDMEDAAAGTPGDPNIGIGGPPPAEEEEEEETSSTDDDGGLPSFFNPDTGPVGQMGQISQQLATLGQGLQNMRVVTPLTQGQGVGRLPSRPSGGSTSRREIHLSGDISGMDPHIQRVLVNALMEIERNRSG